MCRSCLRVRVGIIDYSRNMAELSRRSMMRDDIRLGILVTRHREKNNFCACLSVFGNFTGGQNSEKQLFDEH